MPMQYPGWEQPESPYEPEEPVKRRRRGRKWLIALIVLLLLLVGADRIGLLVAESMLADKIQSSQHLSQKPDVSIDGFPFLTQVAARDFPHATVDIHGLVANKVPISDLHADLQGVHVNSGFSAATVDNLTATASLSYTDLASALGSQISLGGQPIGTITLSQYGTDELQGSFQLLGATVSAVISVKLVGQNEVEFKSVSYNSPVSGLGISPPGFDYTLSLGTLPFGISLTQLGFTSSAIDITAVGHQVQLSQSSTSDSGTG